MQSFSQSRVLEYMCNFYDMGETIKLIDVKKGILMFQKIGNKCPKSFQRYHSTHNLSLPEVTLLNG